jgi:HAD superfamily hydrolase (TIGR01509 family)
MKKYQAVIFDMNGVIIDDEPIHLREDRSTCEHFGLAVPDEEWPKIKGWKVHDIFADFISKYSDRQISADEMVAYKVELYLKCAQQDVELVPGVLNFIKFLRNNDVKLALATSTLKVLQGFIFKKFELDQYFPIIITAEDLKRGKPDPKAYLLAVEKLGIEARQCLVIEDSLNGVQAGKRAGCDVHAITTTYSRDQLLESGADMVFDTFAEMQEYFDINS